MPKHLQRNDVAGSPNRPRKPGGVRRIARHRASLGSRNRGISTSLEAFPMNQAALRKIAAATAIICDELGGSVQVFPLMKALYISDRQMIADYGRPITGDTYSSMPLGPILSETYNFVGGKSVFKDLQARWNEAFKKEGFSVRPKQKINTGSLAPVEEKILRENARLINGIMKTGNLADWMHENCPEWEKVPKGSSKALPIERVVRFSMQVSADDARKIGNSINAAIHQRAQSKLAVPSLLQPA